MHRQKVAFLSSLCLFLSAVEYAIPKPLPFLRLGIANLPVILSLEILSFPEIFVLVALKVLCQSLISGTLFSYVVLFSITGSFSSALIMVLLHRCLKKKRIISPLGISVAGAMANTASQILCSRFILFGKHTSYIAPILMASGLITGILLGIIAMFFYNKSEWYKDFSTEKEFCGKPVENLGDNTIPKTGNVRFILCMIVMAVFLLVNQWVQNLYILWACVFAFFMGAEIKMKFKLNLIPPLMIFLSVTLFSLFVPYGRIIFEWKKICITSGALEKGLHRSGILIGITFLSRIAVDKRVQLPGKVGNLLSLTFYYGDLLFEGKEKRKYTSAKEVLLSADEKMKSVWCQIREESL